MYCVKTKCRHINKINKIEIVFSLSSGRNFVLRRRVNSHVIVIFDFIYDDIHTCTKSPNKNFGSVQIMEVYMHCCFATFLQSRLGTAGGLKRHI